MTFDGHKMSLDKEKCGPCNVYLDFIDISIKKKFQYST